MSYQFSPEGRRILNDFLAEFHEYTGTQPGQEFAVEPSVAQQIVARSMETPSGWFLNMISAYTWVEELKGDKVGLGVDGLISSRIDTSQDGNERTPSQVHGMESKRYELNQVNRDIGLRYAVIDAWRHKKNFSAIWANEVRKAVINDIIRVGWHGTHHSDNTDKVVNPNGEDISKGWLQIMRERKPLQVDTGGTTIGPGGDYPNLDALVNDAKGMIPEQYRGDPGIRVMTTNDIIGIATGRYYANSGDTPSEKTHLNNGRILETYGGLETLIPPFLKPGSLVIGNPANLAHYIQTGSNRRSISENPKKDQVEDYNSANEGYVIEEESAVAVVEGVKEYVAP